MPKLIIFEGPDGVGKSTQAKMLHDVMPGSLLIRQPSDSNVVGFLRSEVKSNPEHCMFERQLMHTVSHIVDAYSYFDGVTDVIMDRSPISAMVYGQVLGLSEYQRIIIERCNFAVYQDRLAEIPYDIRILFFIRPESYKSDKDDLYEQADRGKSITERYLDLAKHHSSFFALREHRYLFDLSLSKECNEKVIHESVLAAVEAEYDGIR